MRLVARLILLVALGGIAAAGGALLLAPEAKAFFSAGTSQDVRLDLEPLSQRSIVYARDGSVLAVFHGPVENRQPVSLNAVPKVLVNAIVDTEDARFFSHGGIDVRGTLRAFYANVQAGGIEQGGSTITQQLVKNTILNAKRDAGRKLKEAVLAVRLEHQLSKQEILERYLNTVYFGNGAYGVQAAAERYFGINVGSIDAGQAALLAAVIRNPLGYDPFVNPDVAKERRELSLRHMVTAKHLSPADADRFAASPLPSKPTDLLPRPDGGTGYFVEEVKQRLLKDTRLGDTPSARYNAVFGGGLEIDTTLDPAWEQRALQDVDAILPNTHGRFTASLVAVEPQTGAVRALVGGPGFDQAKYNLATQGRRQAGSSFKVFTLLAALKDGASPKSSIAGTSPCTIPNPGGTPNPWRPENSEGEAVGTISLTDATAHSVNCAYARLAMIIGIDKVAKMAEDMGITTRLDPTPAMTLGGLRNGVSPLEMASAYATLAAEGVHRVPYLVERVLDREGKVIFEQEHAGKRAVSVQNARVATQVLQEVVKRGTGTRARVRGRQVAGKTGTAQNYTDGWFVGYTPQLATAVWMGAPVGEVPMRNVGGIRVFGGTYPARIWSAFMTDALANQPAMSFTAPNPSLIPKGKYLKLKGDRSVGRRSTSTTRTGHTTTTIKGGATTATTERDHSPVTTEQGPEPTSPPPTSPPATSPSPPATTPAPSGAGSG